MHELGVVFSVIDNVKRVAKENDANHINRVTLQIGEVSTVIPKYLEDVWKWAITKHEMLTDCELVIKRIPAVSYCTKCSQEFRTVSNGKICPYCGSDQTYLKQGNEFIIKDIQTF